MYRVVTGKTHSPRAYSTRECFCRRRPIIYELINRAQRTEIGPGPHLRAGTCGEKRYY